ncbi:MAG: hypothetical protein OXG56_07595, partial [Gammaproteobacteria bacterium]|nr:hypothetical protein [Gammaproteobacteria bacterium]
LSGQYGTYTPKSSSHHHVDWNSASGAPRHAWRTNTGNRGLTPVPEPNTNTGELLPQAMKSNRQ